MLKWVPAAKQKKHSQIKVFDKPPIPDTNWKPPKDFPNLAAAKMLIIDIETKDPNLTTKGPGFNRGDAYMVGLSVGTEDKHKWYFPLKHEYDPNNLNMDYDQVIKWANDELTRPKQAKIGANILYDLEGLHYSGVDVKGSFYDVQVAEPLIDEHARGFYNLNALAKKYLAETKVENELYQWSSLTYGGQATRSDQIKNLWRCPPEIVGPYAESDVDLPIRILAQQDKVMGQQNLLDLFQLECRLIPLLLKMRITGIPVDIKRAYHLNNHFLGKIDRGKDELKHLTGYAFEHIWNAQEISQVFDKAGIKYPLTAKTKKPSITKDFLKNHPSDVAKKIQKLREWDKLVNPFIKSYILDGHINGTIYPQFNQLKNDEAGAAPGRFSSSNPNIQNIPMRTTDGRMLRSMFIPYKNEVWNRADYSQIEYRLLVHYATGHKAEKVKAQYRKNPKTDYHSHVQNEAKSIAGMTRYTAKTINFGTIYGMGVKALAAELGLPYEEAKVLLEKIKAISPYAFDLSDTLQRLAADRGYIRTILNRRNRFPFWEPADWDLAKANDPFKDKNKAVVLVHDVRQLALKKKKRLPRSGVKRAYIYTAVNKLLQGSAADIMKKAMVDVFEAGLTTPTIFMTVHDELDWSSPKTKLAKKESAEIARIMENTIKLSIPVLVDHETGTNWGEVK